MRATAGSRGSERTSSLHDQSVLEAIVKVIDAVDHTIPQRANHADEIEERQVLLNVPLLRWFELAQHLKPLPSES